MDHYGKARREGLRLYEAALRANQDPYLPVLENQVPSLSRLNRHALGIQSVPLDRVIGSVSRGRSYAFSKNFFPILEGGSEFSGKWEHLYTSVEETGMSQPVTLLEYMGYYYVTEGNKRVSVMKSMGALDIEADVTRVLPAPSDSPEYQAYMEYCSFTKDTGLYNLYFSKPGSFQKLLAMPGVHEGDTWTEDEIFSLRKTYNAFRTAYDTLTGEKKPVPVGDAFLRWLTAFDYREILNDDPKKTQERVRIMLQELATQDKVRLVMKPQDPTRSAPSVPLISSLFKPSRVKAAFLYTRPTEESGWEYWHELGRLELEKKLGDKVETTVRIIPSRDSFRDTVDPLIREGYTSIFATTPVMLNSCIEPALKHPEVRFYCCSLASTPSIVQTYYIRFYEAKFLLGLAAGILARNGKIGYIADFPIVGVPSAVNAFALGAAMVNPDAKIYLNWSSATWFNPQLPFEDPDILVVSDRDITAPSAGSREVGLHMKEDTRISNIAALIPSWGPFYCTMIERQLSGAPAPAQSKGTATNYWWGLDSNILDIVFSNRFNAYAMRLINGFRNAMCNGLFSPFEGELRDQNGTIRCEKERRLTPAEILCMDYLLENVVGSLPKLEEIEESASPLVKLQGIHGNIQSNQLSFSWE